MLNIMSRVFKDGNNDSLKITKRIGFGFTGIILGLIFIFIILLVLNYFNAINIFSYFKKNQELLSFQKQTIKSSELVYPKAQKAGYKIYFEIVSKENPRDESGRYILASSKRIVNGWIDKFGWQEAVVSAIPTRGTGAFVGWESIDDSKDRYIVFRDVINSEEFKARVIYENPISYKGIEDKTLLNVDNLEYGPLNNSIEPIEKIDYISEISDFNLDKIINKDDIITVFVPRFKNNNGSESANIQDENNVLIAQSVEIRRFGGLKSISSELK